jgi:ribosomal protein S12 methylthiotransferase
MGRPPDKRAGRSARRTVHFVSLGCPKNRVDTEVMAGLLATDGLTVVASPEEADVIVVNTCAFIGDAKEESIDVLLEMARQRRSGRCSLLIAAGCLPQRNGAELAAAMPEIDAMLGTATLDQIGRLVKGAAVDAALGRPGHFLPSAATPRLIEQGSVSACIKIADGCSRKCAFCAIPGIRGKGRSRSVADVVAEARQLADAGIVELNLVAQDTAAFGRDRKDGADLAGLLDALNDVDGLRWIRLLYLYPDAVSDRLLQRMGELDKVVPYLDIPIQHAAAPVLKAMRRGHGPGTLLDVLDRAKRLLPGAFLRTTVLVGFPGETDADFDALLSFVETARFHHLGAFRYSEEEGTAAAGMSNPVSAGMSYNRWRKVMALQRRIVRGHHRAMKGQTIEVLVEGAADEAGYVRQGRHAGQAPDIDGCVYLTSCAAGPGEVVRARVVDFKDYDLVAEPL